MKIVIDTQKDSNEEIIEAINFLGKLVNPEPKPAVEEKLSETPTVDQLLAEPKPSADKLVEEEKKETQENEEIIPYG